jgi:hypothetical protein
MEVVDDGIITGRCLERKSECFVCEAWTRVINISSITMPNHPTKEGTIQRATNLIFFYGDNDNPILIPRIGIGCGCYAKAHRQLARIQTAMRFR